MIIGTRVVHPEEILKWDAEIYQISVYYGMDNNMSEMRECVRLCREKATPFVIHPVRYTFQNEKMLSDVMEMAVSADRCLILHDERNENGSRLSGKKEHSFRNIVEELRSITTVSFENAVDTADIRWYWETYADNITLDIGHVESAGIDSIEFVHSLDGSTIDKIQYVHMHRNNGLHGGITDHWPLQEGCRELKALEALLMRKADVGVILELNEIEMIENNMKQLRSLRTKMGLSGGL